MVYSIQDDNSKRFKTQRVYLSKGVIETFHVIIYGNNFYYKPTDSDIKHYKEIRKLSTSQRGDYATGCLFNYEYITNQYKLIANSYLIQVDKNNYMLILKQFSK